MEIADIVLSFVRVVLSEFIWISAVAPLLLLSWECLLQPEVEIFICHIVWHLLESVGLLCSQFSVFVVSSMLCIVK